MTCGYPTFAAVRHEAIMPGAQPLRAANRDAYHDFENNTDWHDNEISFFIPTYTTVARRGPRFFFCYAHCTLRLGSVL